MKDFIKWEYSQEALDYDNQLVKAKFLEMLPNGYTLVSVNTCGTNGSSTYAYVRREKCDTSICFRVSDHANGMSRQRWWNNGNSICFHGYDIEGMQIYFNELTNCEEYSHEEVIEQTVNTFDPLPVGTTESRELSAQGTIYARIVLTREVLADATFDKPGRDERGDRYKQLIRKTKTYYKTIWK